MIKTEEKRHPFVAYGGGAVRKGSVTMESLSRSLRESFLARPVWSEPMTMDEYLALDSHDPNMVYVIVGS